MTMTVTDYIDEQQQHDNRSREVIHVTDAYYTYSDEGVASKRAIIHLVGQSRSNDHRHVEIDGFWPYFFISRAEYGQKKNEITIEMNRSNNRIRGVDDGHCSGGTGDGDGDDPYIGIETGGYVELVKIECQLPKHVRALRDWFDRTWEADVPFTNRFLIDQGITSYCTIPTVENGTTIAPTEIKPIETDAEIPSRILTFDIEVHVGEKGFPDWQVPNQCITAITAHDTETDFYWTGILEYPSWEPEEHYAIEHAYDESDTGRDRDGHIEIYSREDQLIYDFIDIVTSTRPSIFCAWNSDFDIGYLIERARNINTGNVSSLSPSDDVWSIDSERKIARAIKGIQTWDAMAGYRKTQIHEPKSMKLENVASEELGMGKEDIESTDHAWKREPVTFTEYSIRDVEATVDILKATGAIELHENLQAMTGVFYQSLAHNSRICDSMMLREATTHDVATGVKH